MTRSDIVKVIHERHKDLRKKDVDMLVSFIIEKISLSVANGDRVELRGFGVFSPKQLASKTTTLPNGDKISHPSRRSIKFHPSKNLIEKLNN